MQLLQWRSFSDDQLRRFTELQRELYAVLEEQGRALRPGEREVDVAARLRAALRRSHGVRSYFHVPVALFGERCAYPGAFGRFEALPTARRLGEGESAILDAAPIIDGHLIDCSLALPGRDAQGFAEGDRLLAELRVLILQRTRERLSMRAIAQEVDRHIRAAGWENAHRKHIGEVLAHRANLSHAPWLARRRLWGLSPLPVAGFLWRSLRQVGSDTPNWNERRRSDHPAPPGLWCVEPHVARAGLGLKFEEMLHIGEDGSARYLDEDLPHLRRWAYSRQTSGVAYSRPTTARANR